MPRNHRPASWIGSLEADQQGGISTCPGQDFSETDCFPFFPLPMIASPPQLDAQIRKASVLIEALPYLQRFRGQIFVIKVGGSAMEDEKLVHALMRDIVFLEVAGINPVVVHGGGKFISAAMAESGLEPVFVNGQRLTDEASIQIVERTLNEEINPSLAQMVEEHGGRALSLHGQSVFTAERATATDDHGNAIDLGFVGRVVDVSGDAIHDALRDERVPVISPLARTADGGPLPLNVNADLAASALACHLKAPKLVYLSDVLGVLRDPADPASLIGSLTPESSEALIAEGVIQGGMIPKVRSSVDALHAGVGKVHLVDGRIPHSLLLEIFTDGGIGTELALDGIPPST